ncbi:carboxypeptidase regulatory-like domain-containing protein, partial [candidate division KSB1 bacterium]|nr:carboxypeptidase regulatory-like domain-containing protein [candidate division KSB1 bacterium]
MRSKYTKTILLMLLSRHLFAVGLTLLYTPDGLFRTTDQISVRWKEPIQCRMKYGLASGVYQHQTTAGGTREMTFTPRDEGMTPGVYYCTIVSGSLSSAEFKLMIESTAAPYMMAPANNSLVSTTTPEFRWDPIPGVPYYHLILSDQEVTLFEDANGDLQLDGGNIIWQIITPNTLAIYGETDPSGFFNGINNNLPPIMQDLEYNWIVLNNYNNHPGYSSIIQSGVFSFRANIAHHLQPTTLLSPEDDAELDGEDIFFEWQSNPTAKAYQFLLSETRPQEGSESSYLIWAPIITETSIECPAKRLLKNGRYFWRVVALDESGRGIGSEPRDFFYSVPMGTLAICTRQAGAGFLPRVEIDIVPQDGSSEISKLLTTDSGMLNNKVHPGIYTIYARKEGYADTSGTATVHADETKNVNLFLKKLIQSISGRVVNQNNQPVPRADVTLQSINTNDRLTIETDMGGGFDVPVSPGAWRLFAHKSGHENSDTLTVTVNAGQKVNISGNLRLFRRAAEISGTVTTPNGIPVQNAVVQAKGIFPSKQAVTNELGRFRLELTAGSWEVFAEKDGYVRSPYRSVQLSAGQNKQLTPDLILQPQASVVTGFVLSEEKLLPGAALFAVPLRGRAVSAFSDAVGCFLFSLAQGDYTLNARLEGYVAPENISIRLAENQTVSGLYILMQRATCRIKGFITRGSQPVAGAVVFCEFVSDTSLADGSYTLWVPPGTSTVDVIYKGLLSPGSKKVTLQQNAVRENLNFNMSSQAGVIQGRVTSAGLVVAAARISTGSGNVYRAISDGDGKYWLTVPPGIWNLDCAKAGFLPGRFTGAAVQAGQTVSGVDFAIELSKTEVRGTVRDEKGRPVKNVLINLVDHHVSAVTDQLGRYALALAAGQYQLRAEKSGYVTQEKPVQVLEGRTVEQNFTLQTKGFIHGRVRNQEESPLDNVLVSADNGISVIATTDYAGDYQLHLNPGSYRLTADRLGYAAQ